MRSLASHQIASRAAVRLALLVFTVAAALTVGAAGAGAAATGPMTPIAQAARLSGTTVGVGGQNVTPNHTPPPCNGCTYMSIAQAKALVTDRYLGPNADTDFGRFHVTGFTGPGSTGYYTTASSLTNGGLTLAGPVSPNSWYNPSMWNWKHIFSTLFTWVDGCVHGSVSGVIQTGSATLLVNLLAKGAKLYIGPYGYAALALGGCLAYFIH